MAPLAEIAVAGLRVKLEKADQVYGELGETVERQARQIRTLENAVILLGVRLRQLEQRTMPPAEEDA